jgi:GH15 family glucan-1,4-alpha-glucosidase
MYRYRPGSDGLEGGEGAFLPCSFYLIEALLTTGRVEDGVRLLDELLGRVGDLCLLPEEIDPATGDFLGNYPLCLSQAGLVHSILEAGRALKA